MSGTLGGGVVVAFRCPQQGAASHLEVKAEGATVLCGVSVCEGGIWKYV